MTSYTENLDPLLTKLMISFTLLIIFTHFYSLISFSLCLTSKNDSISLLQIFIEREYVTLRISSLSLFQTYFKNTSHITQIFAKIKHCIIIISNITTILGKSVSRDEVSAKAKRRIISRDVLCNVAVGIMLVHVFFSCGNSLEWN